MAGGMLRCRQTMGVVALALALLALAPGSARAERTVDSALRRAAQAGDIVAMQHQLALGADPTQACALVAAVQGNQLAALKYLLAHGADPNAQWTRDRAQSQTPLGAAVLAGNLAATQLLLDSGADVNQVPVRGELPLMQAALAPQNTVELVTLLLQRGADPDRVNAEGVSVRQQFRYDARLRALLDQARPATAAHLAAEEPLEVAMALHYKMLCDAGLPGYPPRVAADYARWRMSQAKVLAQLEGMPEFSIRQDDAKAAFEQARAAARVRGGILTLRQRAAPSAMAGGMAQPPPPP